MLLHRGVRKRGGSDLCTRIPSSRLWEMGDFSVENTKTAEDSARHGRSPLPRLNRVDLRSWPEPEPVPELKPQPQRHVGSEAIGTSGATDASASPTPPKLPPNWWLDRDLHHKRIRQVMAIVEGEQFSGDEHVAWCIRDSIMDLRQQGLKEECLGACVAAHAPDFDCEALIRCLAAIVYGGSDKVVLVNGQDERTAAWRLLSSSPGYRGYLEGGWLANELTVNPRRLVWFRNIERAPIGVVWRLARAVQEGTLDCITTRHPTRNISLQETLIVATFQTPAEWASAAVQYDALSCITHAWQQMRPDDHDPKWRHPWRGWVWQSSPDLSSFSALAAEWHGPAKH